VYGIGNARGVMSVMNRSAGDETTVIGDIGHLHHPSHLVRCGDSHVSMFCIVIVTEQNRNRLVICY
jgi:hypothetical protein